MGTAVTVDFCAQSVDLGIEVTFRADHRAIFRAEAPRTRTFVCVAPAVKPIILHTNIDTMMSLIKRIHTKNTWSPRISHNKNPRLHPGEVLIFARDATRLLGRIQLTW